MFQEIRLILASWPILTKLPVVRLAAPGRVGKEDKRTEDA